MRKKAATLVVALTFTAGAALPGAAIAKPAKKAKAPPSLLAQTCMALGLDTALEGLQVSLDPVVRVKLRRICQD